MSELIRALGALACAVGLGATSAPGAASECVPGACDPLCVEPGRYRVRPEVVEDTRNEDRLWQRHAVVRLPWDEAEQYCRALSLEGRSGWRLPTLRELGSLRYKPGGLFGGGGKRHYCVPPIDQAAFPETPADLFWTSKCEHDGTAWYVGFDDGRQHRDTREDEHWVRCTHD